MNKAYSLEVMYSFKKESFREVHSVMGTELFGWLLSFFGRKYIKVWVVIIKETEATIQTQVEIDSPEVLETALAFFPPKEKISKRWQILKVLSKQGAELSCVEICKKFV